MFFNSLAFAVFLPLVFLVYWCLARGGEYGRRAQNLLLLIASYVFYGWWDLRFLGLIALSSAIDFLLGLALGRAQKREVRRGLVYVSLALNLGMLGYFKYYGFFAESLAALLPKLGLTASFSTLNIVLPVGISFYTFQTLSYTLDIYRRKIKPTRDPVAFFAFVSFFPQLVAGPIERASSLLPQFRRPRVLHVGRAKDGLRQMLWGLFKKVVIADNLSHQVEAVFSTSDSQSSTILVFGVVLFAYQIYCDFSGYSDIAIGCARLFGFRLTQNFHYPFFSRNLAELWKRWHITLNTWFRDYLFMPLGGIRRSKLHSATNLIITFGMIGLWHGANWTFLAWGLLNAMFFLLMLTLPGSHRHRKLIAKGRWLPNRTEVGQMMAVWGVIILTLTFFRAHSLTHGVSYLGGMFSAGLLPLPDFHWSHLFILLMLVSEWVQRHRVHPLQISHLSKPLRWSIYYLVIAVIILYGNRHHVPYIYFQF